MSNHGEPLIESVQISYARVLGVAVLTGFVLLFAGFIVYTLGIVPSRVSVDEVPELWHLSARELAARTSRGTGWEWTRQLAQGDQIAFAALVYFPASALVLVLIAGFLYSRQGTRNYAVIAVLEAVVLFVAASGILSSGK
jgi:hypothetical protein